jgi:sugar (pentulose or hexulose) kinase
MPVSLALDFGTTSISAIALRHTGEPVARITHPHDASITGLATGRAEQRPDRLFDLGLDVLSRLVADLREPVVALGLTGQMHGVLLVDDHLEPAAPLITWQDKRSLEPLEVTGPRPYDELLSRVTDADMEPTGCRLSPGYLGTTLYSLGRTNALPPTAKKALIFADWAAARLSGTSGATDPSNAGSTGLFDLQHGQWSQTLLTKSGIAPELLPPVRKSGEPLGGLRGEFARKTGLPEGLSVCNAIGDNQAAVLGSVPAAEPGIQINVGTGGQINWPVGSFTRVPGMDTRALPVNRLMLVGAGLVGGDSFAWVNRTIRQWLSAFGVERSSDEIYDVLNRAAESLPDDNDGLVCKPLFRGTRRQPDARGEFLGVTPTNFTPGHLARAVVRGIVDGFYSFYDQAGPACPEALGRVIGSGNGLRKNALLTREIARQFTRPVFVARHEEEAAYGAALLAGTTTGMWASLDEAGRGIELVRVA